MVKKRNFKFKENKCTRESIINIINFFKSILVILATYTGVVYAHEAITDSQNQHKLDFLIINIQKAEEIKRLEEFESISNYYKKLNSNQNGEIAKENYMDVFRRNDILNNIEVYIDKNNSQSKELLKSYNKTEDQYFAIIAKKHFQKKMSYLKNTNKETDNTESDNKQIKIFKKKIKQADKIINQYSGLDYIFYDYVKEETEYIEQTDWIWWLP
ncbi:hypothetical protein [Streptococcus agalactiae]|uniref:hypothetical protein n=1 Tax=Streptococcus agalactiae TaxID=1311 RepID=UPI000332E951|nr:hypothetical protein [Streptococcus agalactiae]OTG46494.1 hypothetical protein B7934_08435 [Streptococcus agalactiae]CCW40729.1 hypothetical protein MSA_18730 [Streptococcus agalactiae ILRI005]